MNILDYIVATVVLAPLAFFVVLRYEFRAFRVFKVDNAALIRCLKGRKK